MFWEKILQSTANDKKIAIAIFIYTALLLSYWSHLSPLYHSNGWPDPNIYFTIGKSIFNGKALYTDLFDLKGPVLFFIYGLGSLISDHSFLGVFLLEILLWFLMIFAIYRTAKFYLSNAFAYLVALLFPFCIVTFIKTGGSPDEFILAFECISLYFFVAYFKEKEATIHNPYVMLMHGLLFALTLFCKFNLALFWVFPVTALFLNLLLKKTFRNFAWNLVAFLTGFLLIAAPICIYLLVNHAFDDFYAICFELTKKTSGMQSQSTGIQLLFFRLIFVYFVRPVELFILPLIGIFYFSFKFIGHKLGKWAMMLAGISVYLAVFIPPVFIIAYYPLPFLIFSALGILCIFTFINRYFHQIKTLTIQYMLIVLTVLFYMGAEMKDLSDMKSVDFLKAKPGAPLKSIREEILKEKNPTLMTPCDGLGLNLFTTCRIVPNIRFFTFPAPYEFYPVMRDEQTQYIENKAVQFIVLIVPNTDLQHTKWNREQMPTKYDNKREIGYNYFTTLPAFQENYELCLRDTIINTTEQNTLDIYELYKRKD